MQTFLPYKSFIDTAKVLDWKRLGNQRMEAQIILQACQIGNGWSNHPVVKMWKGFEELLKLYFDIISIEWMNRGYQHNMGFYRINDDKLIIPDWLGNEDFHSSHRAALLAKNYDWYSQFGWSETPEINYVWIT